MKKPSIKDIYGYIIGDYQSIYYTENNGLCGPRYYNVILDFVHDIVWKLRYKK